MTVRAIRWIVSGRVQGVGFRWYIMKAASRIGVSGWVRNHQDGTVEVVAAGPQDALDELDAAISQGPSFSHVERVSRADVSLESMKSKSFEIR